MTHQDTCKTCRYWESTPHVLYDHKGSCHIRSAPDLDWPPRGQLDWCGEHEPIKAEIVDPLKPHPGETLEAYKQRNAKPPFPYQDNCPTMQEIMELRAARESRGYGRSLDADTAREEASFLTSRHQLSNQGTTLTPDEAQQARKLGIPTGLHGQLCACELCADRRERSWSLMH